MGKSAVPEKSGVPAYIPKQVTALEAAWKDAQTRVTALEKMLPGVEARLETVEEFRQGRPRGRRRWRRHGPYATDRRGLGSRPTPVTMQVPGADVPGCYPPGPTSTHGHVDHMQVG